MFVGNSSLWQNSGYKRYLNKYDALIQLQHMCNEHKYDLQVHCLTGEDALALTQMLEYSEKFEISHLYFYFNDWPLVAEFWTALLNQLKRFPVKKLDTFKRGLLGARMEDLKEIWESCILEELKVGSTYVELGELEGWQRIEELVAKVGGWI